MRHNAPSLELYQKENCPFSHAVRNRLTKLGLDFIAHTVPDDQPLKHEKLVQAGGKDQVPFLIDHTSGIKLYESQAILAYLDKTYGKEPGTDWMSRLTQLIDTRMRAWADPIAWQLSSPLLRAQRSQLDARNAIKTLEGSLEYFRNRVYNAINEGRAKAQGTRATAEQPTPENLDESASQASGETKVRPLKSEKAKHADVESATGTS
jgi:glutathione S-transferase